LNTNQSQAIGELREWINMCQQMFPRDTSLTSSVIPSTVLENSNSDNFGYLASTYGGLLLSNSTGKVDIAREYPNVDGALYVPREWEQLSSSTKVKLAGVLSLKNLDSWDFNVLDVVKVVNPTSVLVLVGWAIIASPYSQQVMMTSIDREYVEEEGWGGYNFSALLGVDHKTLVSYLRSLEALYNSEEKYHNNIHAADVTQTLHSMFRMGMSELSHSLTTADLYSMLLAAAAHDVGHPGTNNIYQVNAQTDLAIIYNDKSPLENMHASKASQLTKQLGLLDNFSSEQKTHIRSTMISAILATDMAHHFSKVSLMDEYISQYENDGVDWYEYVNNDDSSAQGLLNYMIHLADISNPTKMQSLAVYWAKCALAEFFSQGDLEREANLPISPLCDRENTNLATSQRDFIRFVVLPSYKVLGRLFPKIAAEIVPKADENLRYWERLCEDSS
jgi:hypothetical protein